MFALSRVVCVVLCLAALTIGAIGCKSVVELQSPEFITAQQAREADLLALEAAKAEAASPAAKEPAVEEKPVAEKKPVAEEVFVTDPTEVSKAITALSEIDFAKGYDGVIDIVQLSRDELTQPQIEAIGKVIKLQLEKTIRAGYYDDDKADEKKDFYYKAPDIINGAKMTVEVTLPKEDAVSRVHAYARTVQPKTAKTLLGLVEITYKPADPVLAPYAKKGILFAYRFSTKISVPGEQRLAAISSGDVNELFKIIAALDSAMKTASAPSVKPGEGSRALEMVRRLQNGIKVELDGPVSSAVGNSEVSLAVLTQLIVDRFAEYVTRAMLIDCQEYCKTPREDFLEKLRDSNTQSIMRTVIARSIQCTPGFFDGATLTPKLAVLAGAKQINITLGSRVATDAKDILFNLEDKCLRAMAARGEFSKMQRDPGDYKTELGWLSDRMSPRAFGKCSVMIPVLFGDKSAYLPGPSKKMGIMHPTVQHEQLALRSVYNALIFSDCTWDAKTDTGTYGLKIERSAASATSIEIGRKLVKEHPSKKLPTGVFARFTFEPEGENANIDLSDFNGGTVTIYAKESASGAEWAVRDVKKLARRNAVQFDLLVAPSKSRPGDVIEIPLLELRPPKKRGTGVKTVKAVEFRKQVIRCEREDDDQPGEKVPMMVVVQIPNLKGSLDLVRDYLSESNPTTLFVSRKIQDGGETWERQEGYRLNKSDVGLLSVSYFPYWNGKFQRVGWEQEIRVDVSGAEREIVAFMPLTKEKPWGDALKIALTMDYLAQKAEDIIVKQGKAMNDGKGVFESSVGGRAGEALFRNKLRDEVMRQLPALLPDSQDANAIMDGLKSSIRRRVIPQGGELKWGIKPGMGPDMRTLIQNVIGTGDGLKLAAEDEKTFGSYGRFLVQISTLRNYARDMLTRKGKLSPAFIRLVKKGDAWIKEDGYRMYLDESEVDDRIMIGAYNKAGETGLPKIFFVKVDGAFQFYCTDGRIRESNRNAIQGRSLPTWPRVLRDAAK
jgi:hypothetical protein